MFAVSHIIARAITRVRELLHAAERVELEPIATPKAKHGSNTNHARGEAAGASKLNKAKVRAIRCEVAAGASRRAVAKRYGVTEGAIRGIVNRTTWRHVMD